MTEDVQDNITIRAASVVDAPRVCRLIEPFVARKQLLHRSTEEISRLIKNGFVAEMSGEVVGFSAIDIYSRKMAELVCLAVAESCQGKGVGRLLVESCIQRAREHKVHELMAISAAEDFMKSCGFDFTLPEQKKAFFIHPGESSTLMRTKASSCDHCKVGEESQSKQT